MNNTIFQISKIVVDQFATFEIAEPESKRVKIDLNFDLGIDEPKRLVTCSITFMLLSKDQLFLKLQVTCEFIFNEKEWTDWADEDSKQSNIPLEVIKNLADNTLATARGVLHIKTATTKYSEYYIPVIDLSNVITGAVRERLNSPSNT